MDHHEIADILADTTVFGALSDEQRMKIAEQGTIRKISKDSILFSEGEICDRFYVVLKGRAHVFKRNNHGREQILKFFGPADMFASGPFFAGKPYPVSALARSDSVLFEIGRCSAIDDVFSNAAALRKLLEYTVERNRELVDLVATLSLEDVSHRLAHYLLHEAEAHPENPNGGIVLSRSKAEIAKALGTVREVNSRAFTKLQKLGFIRTSGRQVEIIDPDGLRKFGED
ncbi:MAG: Crp/Fnr family transcriptional regulator [Planctomycetes bacterium]|nr:Crp/Fnr family transcriptional regulator [Planctomycetota bacterium]